MSRNLFRVLALVSVLSVTSIATADSYSFGYCYVHCWDGTTSTTYGPYWSTPESCCEDLQLACGGNGWAYTDYPESTYPSRVFCLS